MKPQPIAYDRFHACTACAILAMLAAGAPTPAHAQATAAAPTSAEPVDDLPPAPPPAPGAPEPTATSGAAAAPDAAPAGARARDACPLGQRRQPGGGCVDADPDVWADDSTPIPESLTGYHTHDGFMLRLSGGVGVGTTVSELPLIGELKLTGIGWMFSLDVGGTIADSLVLHGRLATMRLLDPRIELNGDEVANADGVLNITHLGPGLTYYIMPYNIYFTVTAGVTLADVEGDAGDVDTDAGWGLSADFGKEWWVDNDWGIGVAGRVMLGSVALENIDADATISGFGVLFTATFQ